MSNVPKMPSEAEQEAEVVTDLQRKYDDMVKQETDEKIKQEEANTGLLQSSIKGMGFVDKETMTKEILELRKENEAIKAEFTKLREFLLRAKAQGKAVIPSNSDKPDALSGVPKEMRELLNI